MEEEAGSTNESITRAECREVFRQMSESDPEIIWTLDVDTQQIIFVSPAYERVCGRTCASLYENPLSYREVIHPDDRERVLGLRPRRRENWYRKDEFRIVRPDGEVRWLWTSTFPIRDRERRRHQLTGVSEDITERKRAEEKGIPQHTHGTGRNARHAKSNTRRKKAEPRSGEQNSNGTPQHARADRGGDAP